MPSVAALYVYPVKSCAALQVERAVLGAAGLEAGPVCDREWMIVDAQGRFLTQREEPALARIVPSLRDATLVLSAPGVAPFILDTASPAHAQLVPVHLWDSALHALDCGDAAAQWLSALLDQAVRLVRFDMRCRRESSRAYTGEVTALNRFSDGYPILVLSESSLGDLNDRLHAEGRARLPMNRFRPNIVLAGLEAYDEDHVLRWTAPSLALRPVKPCPRCAIPSVDQLTGVPGPDPRDILATYRLDARHGIVLGQNTVIEHGVGQELRVGQPLEVHWNF